MIVIYDSRVVRPENCPYYDSRVVIYAQKCVKDLPLLTKKSKRSLFSLSDLMIGSLAPMSVQNLLAPVQFKSCLRLIPQYFDPSCLIRISVVQSPEKWSWLQTVWQEGGSPGLGVTGVDSRLEGRGFESQPRILNGHLSHIFGVKIVMFVWKDKNKRKRGREWTIEKHGDKIAKLFVQYLADVVLCTKVHSRAFLQEYMKFPTFAETQLPIGTPNQTLSTYYDRALRT